MNRHVCDESQGGEDEVRMKGRNEMGGATCMQEVYEEGSPPCQLYSSRNKGGNSRIFQNQQKFQSSQFYRVPRVAV